MPKHNCSNTQRIVQHTLRKYPRTLEAPQRPWVQPSWQSYTAKEQPAVYPGYTKGHGMGAWRWYALQFFASLFNDHGRLQSSAPENWGIPSLVDPWMQQINVSVRVSGVMDPWNMHFWWDSDRFKPEPKNLTFTFRMRPHIDSGLHYKGNFQDLESFFTWNMSYWCKRILSIKTQPNIMPMEMPGVPVALRPSLLRHYLNGGTDETLRIADDGEPYTWEPKIPDRILPFYNAGILLPWWRGTTKEEAERYLATNTREIKRLTPHVHKPPRKRRD